MNDKKRPVTPGSGSARQRTDAKNDSPDARLRFSIQLAASGKLDSAAAEARSLLGQHPQHLPARIHLARVLLASGRPSEALADLKQCLAGQSLPSGEEVQVLLLAADAALRTGQAGQAESWARQVTALAPRSAQALLILAMCAQQTGRPADALAFLYQALAIDPNSVPALVNKGLVEKQLGLHEEAIGTLNRALSINPAIPSAHYSLGLIHLLRSENASAERAFRACLGFDARHSHAAMQLGTLLRYENRLDEAADVYRSILRHEPDNATARFHLDALTQSDGPARIPADVVRAIYADESVGRNLEASLNEHLRYQTPSILREALDTLYGTETPALDVLDLGCGSGLYGRLVKPRARHLVGVDLSGAMIEECRHKGVYDDLHAKDIVEYLGTPRADFDLIVAMDVFCYFGDLHALMAMCVGVLRPGGILACSVERATENRPWQFHRYGHFLHSSAHLEGAASAAGLRTVQLTESALRREFGEDRPGYVALFARAG